MESNIYVVKGYANRKAYLTTLAQDYELDYPTVAAIAAVLGPHEDFDGLVSHLEDIAND